jgi:predicted RNase H-like HicB family nuclease
MTFSAVLNAEGDGYVALCPELDIASHGDTVETALANLKEALEGFFEVASADEVRTRLKKPAWFTSIEVTCNKMQDSPVMPIPCPRVLTPV